MTVGELIKELMGYNPEIEVYIPHDDGEHQYYIVNSTYQKRLTVLDDDTDCIIIDYE